MVTTTLSLQLNYSNIWFSTELNSSHQNRIYIEMSQACKSIMLLLLCASTRVQLMFCVQLVFIFGIIRTDCSCSFHTLYLIVIETCTRSRVSDGVFLFSFVRQRRYRAAPIFSFVSSVVCISWSIGRVHHIHSHFVVF